MYEVSGIRILEQKKEENNLGLWQSCSMSPLLFNMLLAKVVRQCNLR